MCFYYLFIEFLIHIDLVTIMSPLFFLFSNLTVLINIQSFIFSLRGCLIACNYEHEMQMLQMASACMYFPSLQLQYLLSPLVFY